MSSYENYTQKSRNYDKTREPVGTEISVGCFAHAPVPLDRAEILDAGCGTGNYSRAMLDYVGRIEAVDMNPGMLEVAAQKLAGKRDEGRISFHSARIDELPFEDEHFDGVMINQVLHHLPDEAAKDFPAHRRVFAEFARVLKPGGVLTVKHLLPRATAPRLLAVQPHSGSRRRPARPLRPPRRTGRDPLRQRLRVPGKVRAGRRPRPGRLLLRPPRSPFQGVAGR